MSKIPVTCTDGQPHRWGYTYVNIGEETYTKNCSRCGVRGDLEPFGECLCCGHFLPLAIWPGEASIPQGRLQPEVAHGVCFACRDLAEPNRGACSYERGCACAKTGRQFVREQGGQSEKPETDAGASVRRGGGT